VSFETVIPIRVVLVAEAVFTEVVGEEPHRPQLVVPDAAGLVGFEVGDRFSRV